MAEVNECYAYFHLAGNFDPAELTRRVGVKPTWTCVEGEPLQGHRAKTMVCKCSRWTLHSRLEKTESLEAHVDDVLAQLDANKLGFKELSLEFGGVMELVGYFRAYYPGLFLEGNTVARLAFYSLSADLDFYYCAEEKADPGGTQGT